MSSAPFFVLVVEDEPFARMVHLGAIARLPGVSAVGVGSVSEAQTIIAQQAPQVVVLDLQLTDGTGIDVMARLAEQRIPAVLIVVSAHIETFRSRLRHGPDQQQNFFSSVTVLSVGRFGGGRCWDSVAIGRGVRPPFRSPPKTPIGAL